MGRARSSRGARSKEPWFQVRMRKMLLRGGTLWRSLMEAWTTVPLRRWILPTSSSERTTSCRSSSRWRRAGGGRGGAPRRWIPSSCASARRARRSALWRGGAMRRGRVDRHHLDDGGADQDAVALLQARPLDLFAVDERAVGGAQVLDDDLVAGARRSSRACARPCPRPGPCRGRSNGRRRSPDRMRSGNSPPWYFPEMKRSASWRGVAAPRLAGAWASIAVLGTVPQGSAERLRGRAHTCTPSSARVNGRGSRRGRRALTRAPAPAERGAVSEESAKRKPARTLPGRSPDPRLPGRSPGGPERCGRGGLRAKGAGVKSLPETPSEYR